MENLISIELCSGQRISSCWICVLVFG